MTFSHDGKLSQYVNLVQFWFLVEKRGHMVTFRKTSILGGLGRGGCRSPKLAMRHEIMITKFHNKFVKLKFNIYKLFS